MLVGLRKARKKGIDKKPQTAYAGSDGDP